MTATLAVTFPELLSASEQETVLSTFKAQLDSWYSSLSLVFTVIMQPSRRSATTYTLLATAETNNPSAVSSTVTIGLSHAIAFELSTALPEITLVFPSSGFATSVEQKLTQVSIDSTEIDAKERGSGGTTGIGILIGAVVGAIAISVLIVGVMYRKLIRRQIPANIDNVNVVQRVQGPTVTDPGIYVDHVAGHQIANMDACLSETNAEFSEQSGEHSFDRLSYDSPSPSFIAIEEPIVASSPMKFDSSSQGMVTGEEEDLWEYDVKDIEYAEQLFEGTMPVFERSFSDTCDPNNSAPSA